VFCISQNLQMYEVTERASDGKASGRCSGSPKGFRYIGPRLCVRAGFLALTLIRSRKLKFSTIFHTKHVTPPDAKPLLQAVFFICQLRLSLSQSFLLLVSLRCCRKRNLRKLSKFYLLARLYQLQLVCLFLQVS